MKVEKLKPMVCVGCFSTLVRKVKNDIICDDCSTVFEPNGKTRTKDKERLPNSVNPKIEMGDCIEGTVGVHEYK